jgi:septal ring factor EnvC (AmiA/AmiB activator)
VSNPKTHLYKKFFPLICDNFGVRCGTGHYWISLLDSYTMEREQTSLQKMEQIMLQMMKHMLANLGKIKANQKTFQEEIKMHQQRKLTNQEAFKKELKGIRGKREELREDIKGNESRTGESPAAFNLNALREDMRS